MIKHVIFDVDGTILDTQKPTLEALRIVIEEMQETTLPEDISFIFGYTTEEGLRRLGCTNIQEVAERWVQKLGEQDRSGYVFPEIAELMQELKVQGYKIGVITNRLRHEYNFDFDKLAISEYIDFSVCADDVSLPKPSAEPMLYYLKQMHAKPDEAVFIGDTKADMLCAKQSDVISIVAGWGVEAKDEIVGDYYLATPIDLWQLPMFKQSEV